MAVFGFSLFQVLFHVVLASLFMCSRCACFVVFWVLLLAGCCAGSSAHGGCLKGLTSSIALSKRLGNSRARFSKLEQCAIVFFGVFVLWMLGFSHVQIGWLAGRAGFGGT